MLIHPARRRLVLLMVVMVPVLRKRLHSSSSWSEETLVAAGSGHKASRNADSCRTVRDEKDAAFHCSSLSEEGAAHVESHCGMVRGVEDAASHS